MPWWMWQYWYEVSLFCGGVLVGLVFAYALRGGTMGVQVGKRGGRY